MFCLMSVIEPNTAVTLESATLTVSWYILATSSMPAYGMVNMHFSSSTCEYNSARIGHLLSKVQAWQLYGEVPSQLMACELDERVPL